tara:strand:+ start:154 stop:510 length:357 start_codon:yes stop_codon:yes gene_type:complete
MIDTDKYEGHTPAPWTIDVHKVGKDISAIVIESNMTTHSNCVLAEVEVENKYAEADARLIADAPLLLEEVKRLREALKEANELEWQRREWVENYLRSKGMSCADVAQGLENFENYRSE